MSQKNGQNSKDKLMRLARVQLQLKQRINDQKSKRQDKLMRLAQVQLQLVAKKNKLTNTPA